MATEVSSVAQMLYREEEEEKGRDLITRDFLGGCALNLELSISSQVENTNGLMDLNMPPTTTAPFLSPSASCIPSVCTIEKVKSALERVERESQGKHHERSCDRSASPSPSPSPSSTSSITYSPIKRLGAAAAAAEAEAAERVDGCDWSGGGGGGLIAAACSNCLLYVLISKENPRCPRCDSHVPVPVPTPVLKTTTKKKARIDLNTTRNYF
ncbi:uncharacterized protein LOC109712340 [Ananas comosus]|uniref:Uncharacterized protein LOC109712340 n=1 Tax=Ananas comosus TaxID=4615 RepID=A0A6P5F761_ANACO|nr:uncharacterized protein LOC109712340 [Ananas comosus]